jgi:hypothetical protein
MNEMTEAKKKSILNELYKTRTPSQRKDLSDRIIELSNMGAIGDIQYAEVLYKKYGIPQLTGKEAESIIKQSEEIQKINNIFKRQEAINKMMAEIKSKIPAGIAGKVKAYTLINTLLNTKTILSRNVFGNISQMAAMRVNKVMMSEIDWMRSKLTGKDRRITWRTNRGFNESLIQFTKDIGVGLKTGWEGYNPYGTISEFKTATQQFRGKYNPLTYAEKSLGALLGGAGDYPFYMKSVMDSIGEQSILRAMNEGYKGKDMKIKAREYADDIINSALKMSEFAKEALDAANRQGEKATFRDPNIVSTILREVHDVLNVVGFGKTKRQYAGVASKQYGLGDLVVFFAQTPGALLNIGLEYSPLGILKSMYHVSKGIYQKAKGTGSIDYDKVTQSILKAVSGTLMLSGFAYYLAMKGAMTGKDDDDRDAREFLDESGKKRYSVNVTAVERWFRSGFKDETLSLQDGDKWVTYDWLAPFSFNIGMGADFAQAMKEVKQKEPEKKMTLKEVLPIAWKTGIESLYNDNTIRNLITPFSGYSPEKSLEQTITGSVTRFVPFGSILNMVRQSIDNKSRSTQSDDMLIKMRNLVINRLPGLSETLPEIVTTTGNTKELYQGGTNNILNVLLNPGYVKTFNKTPATQLLIDLYEKTGETKQFPRKLDKDVTIYNQKITLTPEQLNDMQRYTGYATMLSLDEAIKSGKIEKMSETEQVESIQKLLTSIGENAEKYMADKLGIKKTREKPTKPVPKLKAIK